MKRKRSLRKNIRYDQKRNKNPPSSLAIKDTGNSRATHTFIAYQISTEVLKDHTLLKEVKVVIFLTHCLPTRVRIFKRLMEVSQVDAVNHLHWNCLGALPKNADYPALPQTIKTLRGTGWLDLRFIGT